jgi:hypothetical protein
MSEQKKVAAVVATPEVKVEKTNILTGATNLVKGAVDAVVTTAENVVKGTGDAVNSVVHTVTHLGKKEEVKEEVAPVVEVAVNNNGDKVRTALSDLRNKHRNK